MSPGPVHTLAVSAFPSPTTSGAAHTFTVTVQDAYGNISTGYTGTVHFTSSDTKATAGNGLPPDYTFTSGTGDDNGAHTFTATLITTGPQSITATDIANNAITGAESNIVVNPAGPGSVVLAGYPLSTTAGAAHNITVTIYDTNGNVDSAYTGTIHFTTSDSRVTAGNGLPADYTFSSGTGDDNGVHTFSATLKTAGPQSITATDTANSALSGTQSSLIVSPAGAGSLVVSAYPLLTTAGAAHNFTVTAYDPYGNIATAYTGTVHFTSSDTQATAGSGLPANYTFTTGAGSDDGSHAFSATLKTAGTQSVTATDTSNNALLSTQSGIVVNPATVNSLVVSGYPSPTTAGAAHQFTVTAYDSYGNIATAYTGTVHFTSSDTQATAGSGLPANYAFTTGTGADDGSHLFSATLKTFGPQSISAADTVSSALTSTQSGIVVNAAAVNSFVVSGYPSPTGAGAAHNLSVTAYDPYGNIVTGYAGAVHFTSSDPQAIAGSGLPANYTFTTGVGNDDGSHVFSATLKTAGTQSITVTDTANNARLSAQTGIVVNPATVNSLIVSGYPSPTASGAAHTFTVVAEDPYGNIATGYTDTVHFISSDTKATAGNGLPADYTFTSGTGDDNGSHTFTATLITVGSQSITATDTANNAVTGAESNVVVNPAGPGSVVLSGYPSSTTAGAAHNFTVAIYDTNGNVDTAYTGTIHFTSSDSKAAAGNGLPANYTFTTGSGGDNGVHTFIATLRTAGTQSITATDTANGAISGARPASSSIPQRRAL